MVPLLKHTVGHSLGPDSPFTDFRGPLRPGGEDFRHLWPPGVSLRLYFVCQHIPMLWGAWDSTQDAGVVDVVEAIFEAIRTWLAGMPTLRTPGCTQPPTADLG